MVEGNIVKIDISGVLVEGEIIHRSQHDIDVKILTPYKGLTTGVHIPYFAPPPHNSFFGEYGDRKAERLLLELYEIAEFTEANINMLHDKYQPIRIKIDEMSIVDMTREKFLWKRADLRKQVKDGLMDNNEYGKKLNIIRKKMVKFSTEIFFYQWDFFKENYPSCMTGGMSEQLIPIIENKRSLKC